MKILIDNGHGVNTPGKCSPDMSIQEYSYTREIARRVVESLKEKGYDAERIVTEHTDVSISERCRRVNKFCKDCGPSNCLLVSIHLDACGADGKWHSASGFSVRVAPNASARSKLLAQCFSRKAKEKNLFGNRCVPQEGYWVQNLGMCRDTNCPAVLTENLFQDCKEDVKFLLSEQGKASIIALHVEAIEDYVKSNV